MVRIDDQMSKRANTLEKAGYGAFDALHLAAGESAGVDVLLSTDDQFIRLALRGAGRPRVAVKIRYPGYGNSGYDRTR
jgi:hypothetical protein